MDGQGIKAPAQSPDRQMTRELRNRELTEMSTTIGGIRSTAPASQPAVGQSVVVKQGETLEDIAKAKSIGVADILLANPQLKGCDQAKPGMELRLPTSPGLQIISASILTSSDKFERAAPAATGGLGQGSVGLIPENDRPAGLEGFAAVPLYELQAGLSGGIASATPIEISNEPDGAAPPHPGSAERKLDPADIKLRGGEEAPVRGPTQDQSEPEEEEETIQC